LVVDLVVVVSLVVSVELLDVDIAETGVAAEVVMLVKVVVVVVLVVSGCLFVVVVAVALALSAAVTVLVVSTVFGVVLFVVGVVVAVIIDVLLTVRVPVLVVGDRAFVFLDGGVVVSLRGAEIVRPATLVNSTFDVVETVSCTAVVVSGVVIDVGLRLVLVFSNCVFVVFVDAVAFALSVA